MRGRSWTTSVRDRLRRSRGAMTVPRGCVGTSGPNHHPFGAVRHRTGWTIDRTDRSAEGVVELAPDRLGCQPGGSPRTRRGARQARSSRSPSRRSRPASFSASRPARTRLSGPARRAGRGARTAASSSPGAIVAPPPHGARTTNPPSGRRRGEDARRRPASRSARRRWARSSPVAADRARRSAGRSAGVERPDRADRPRSPPSPGASRIRYQVWTSNPSPS